MKSPKRIVCGMMALTFLLQLHGEPAGAVNFSRLLKTFGIGAKVIAKDSGEAVINRLPPIVGASAKMTLPAVVEPKDKLGNAIFRLINLDAKIFKQGIDMLVSREKPMVELIHALRNPNRRIIILEGNRGVGKASILEYLIGLVHAGDSMIPDLEKKRFVKIDSKDFISLDGGTTANFDVLIASLRQNEEESKNIVFYMDNLEDWFKAEPKDVSSSQGDSFKQKILNRIGALEKTGATVVISATTEEKDRVFSHQFADKMRSVLIAPATVTETMAIFKAQQKFMDENFGHLSEEIKKFAATVAEKEMASVGLPGSAIRLLGGAKRRVDYTLATNRKFFISQLRREIEEIETALAALSPTYIDLLERDSLQADLLIKRKRFTDAEAQLKEFAKEFDKLTADVKLSRELQKVLLSLKGEARKLKQADVDLLALEIKKDYADLRIKAPAAVPILEDEKDFIFAGLKDEYSIDEKQMAALIKKYSGKKAYMSLGVEISKAVIGHNSYLDYLVRLIVSHLNRSNAGPFFAFLLGVSQTGKTFFVKMLGKILGYEVIVIKGSEYTEDHMITRLVGSPPSFIGFGTPGVLKDGYNRNGKNVIFVFDEWEKLAKKIKAVALAACDPSIASVDDTTGKFSTKGMIFIATSNVAASFDDEYAEAVVKRPSSGLTMQKIKAFFDDLELGNSPSSLSLRLRDYFDKLVNPDPYAGGAKLERIEILKRAAAFIWFGGFKGKDITRLLRLSLNNLATELADDKKVKVEFSEYVVEYLSAIISKVEAKNISNTEVESVISEVRQLVEDLIENSAAQSGDSMYVSFSTLEMGIKSTKTFKENVEMVKLAGLGTKIEDLNRSLIFKVVSVENGNVVSKAIKHEGMNVQENLRIKIKKAATPLYPYSTVFESPAAREIRTRDAIAFKAIRE